MRSRHSRLLALGVGLVAVLFLGPARADEAPPDKAACTASFEQAQRLRRASSLIASRKHLEICARDPCPEALQPICTQWLTEVEQAIPSIVVGVRQVDGADVGSFTVRIDGKVAEGGKPVEIDPGEHMVSIEAGSARQKRSIYVMQGEKARALAFVIDPPAVAPSQATSPPPVVTTRPVPWYTWALGAVGLVGAGGFASFALLGEGRYGELEQCKPRCDPSRVDDARRDYAIGDVALAVGLVAAGAAVVTFLTRPTVTSPRPSIGVGQR